jgi:PAS domain-containing protein
MKEWEIRGVTVDVRRPDGSGPGSSVDLLDPLRVLVNQVPALFWTTDAELVLTSSLGAEFARLGLGPNQLVGAALAELFESGQNAELIEAHNRALAGSSLLFEAGWARKSFRARVAPLRDGADQIIGTICVAVEKGWPEREGPIDSDR